jgi:hypothetical protein
MAEELTREDGRKLEVWKKKLRVWKLGDCCETANRGDDPRFAFHENSDKRDGARDLGSLPEQVPDGIRGRLQQQHCAEKGDIRLHFDILHLMREDLASMGHSPSEDDFYAVPYLQVTTPLP